MAEGTLIVNAKKQFRIKFVNSKGKEVEHPVPDAELSQSLKKEIIEKLNGRKVELDEVGGQPKKVRPVGEPFSAPTPPPPVRSSQQQQGSQQRGPQGRSTQGRRQPQQSAPTVRGAFHNPYNFVPALPREGIAGELGDDVPIGHHVLHPDRFTGVIRVKMTVKTPLLVPDATKMIEYDRDDPQLGIKAGHKSFPVCVDADGKPYIPPTSLKGMLRTAYEAVTNSRLAVFAGHEDRLADRMPARDGLSLVPARISDGNGELQIELLPGNSGISSSGKPVQGDPMYSAWLPRYRQSDGSIAPFAIRYPDKNLPEDGDNVEVWLELWERSGNHPFDYWSVRKCVRVGGSLGSQPPQGQPRGSHRPVQNVAMIKVFGVVCITNRNIDRKHDERVFFTTRNEPILHSLTDELRQQWCELITNYQSIHDEERRAGMAGPPALNNSVWSRQVVGGLEVRQLSNGTLCYAAFRDGQMIALYPVMISRRLFESSPQSLLPESLHPATSLDKLSPADRVFGWVNQRGKGAYKVCEHSSSIRSANGWVNQRGKGAYKGNVRIGPVTCHTPKEKAIEPFGTPGLPLAILGQPKPQQARFYVAVSENGETQRKGLGKEQAGYSPGKGLRGRKVYPHHNGLPNGHWDNGVQDRTQQSVAGHVQEYRRPDSDKVRDNQNRSIQGWVKPGTEFTFDIHVTNLSKVELGALLWILSLPDNHFHRFGGGKPLGFGSVRLEIDSANTHLHDGNDWKQTYSTLADALPNAADRNALIQDFRDAVRTSYGSASFEDVSFIAAWLKMASGHADNLPTHYPRAQLRPDPDGKNFKWFTLNEGDTQESLGNLIQDPGLTIIDK
ncbi:MAG: TIGR03986 family CRISPR-associated RAMP protein [Zavarzinella sp.]